MLELCILNAALRLLRGHFCRPSFRLWQTVLEILLTCHDLICLGHIPTATECKIIGRLPCPQLVCLVSGTGKRRHCSMCSVTFRHADTPIMQGLRGFGGLGCSGSPPGVQIGDNKAEGHQRNGSRADWEAFPELSNAGGECCFPASWPAPNSDYLHLEPA